MDQNEQHSKRKIIPRTSVAGVEIGLSENALAQTWWWILILLQQLRLYVVYCALGETHIPVMDTAIAKQFPIILCRSLSLKTPATLDSALSGCCHNVPLSWRFYRSGYIIDFYGMLLPPYCGFSWVYSNSAKIVSFPQMSISFELVEVSDLCRLSPVTGLFAWSHHLEYRCIQFVLFGRFQMVPSWRPGSLSSFIINHNHSVKVVYGSKWKVIIAALNWFQAVDFRPFLSLPCEVLWIPSSPWWSAAIPGLPRRCGGCCNWRTVMIPLLRKN